jgi:hypothetical protein
MVARFCLALLCKFCFKEFLIYYHTVVLPQWKFGPPPVIRSNKFFFNSRFKNNNLLQEHCHPVILNF